MSAPHALAALAALGQPTRLEIFRLLMRREPDGLPAGAIADTIGCPHNTLSSHLGILARSGLVRGTRDGRSIIYRADVEGIRALSAFLVPIAATVTRNSVNCRMRSAAAAVVPRPNHARTQRK